MKTISLKYFANRDLHASLHKKYCQHLPLSSGFSRLVIARWEVRNYVSEAMRRLR